MDPSSLILIVVGAVAIIALVGAFSIIFRRSAATTHRQASAEARPLHQETMPTAEVADSSVAIEAEPVDAAREPVESVPVRIEEQQRIVEVSPEEGGVSRREFFNRALAGSFGAFLAILSLDALAFFWPRLSGGFGGKVDAGPVGEIVTQLTAGVGTAAPYVVSEARAYVVPITAAQVEGSQFNQPGLVAGELMALWWRCVHLGCRAPWCAPSAGFECPCHGSKYNMLGEYQAGPAPRNLDRFAVEVTADGRLIIDTGTIVQTSRAPRDTVPYPQGPSCIGV